MNHAVIWSVSSGNGKEWRGCKKLKVERLIGAGSTIIFKGSGFYQTDYRSEEYKARVKAETSSSDNKDKKSKKEKKTDVKD